MKAIIVRHEKIKISDRYIINRLKTILSILKRKSIINKERLQSHNVVLVFLKNKKMQEINLQYRKKNKVTDVLSFESESSNRMSSEEESSLGEILFAPKVLAEQAQENQHSIYREFDYLLIHGILHLLGYDHEKSHREEKIMFDIQDRLFSQLTE